MTLILSSCNLHALEIFTSCDVHAVANPMPSCEHMCIGGRVYELKNSSYLKKFDLISLIVLLTSHGTFAIKISKITQPSALVLETGTSLNVSSRSPSLNARCASSPCSADCIYFLKVEDISTICARWSSVTLTVLLPFCLASKLASATAV